MTDYDLCKQLEHYETPRWAAESILKKEVLPKNGVVIDPCCGAGVLSDVAKSAGYKKVKPVDIHDWGYDGTIVGDFLEMNNFVTDATVFMNPPFSKATDFVEHAFEIEARKIICFQRFAWWESRARKSFWEKHPPHRVYICGDRAASWRHDIPEHLRVGSTPTAHAWFVWERWHPRATTLHHIWKD